MPSFAQMLLRSLRALAKWLSRRWITVVGWSELIGGSGAGMWFVFENRSTPSQGLPGLALLGALAFCATSCLAGVQLLRGRPSGRALSIAVQAAQVLRVVVAGVAWRATAGLAMTVWYSKPGGWDALIGATAAFRAAHASAVNWEVGANLFAVFAIYALLRARRPACDENGHSIANG